MKVLLCSFQCEANSFCDEASEIKDFEVHYGKECLDRLAATQYFERQNIECIPIVFANALPCGFVSRFAYNYFEQIIIDGIKAAKDYDGIYLYLHGSMVVEGNISGEELLTVALRKVIGENIPISVALDFHANPSDKFLQSVDAVNAFRTAPHKDHDETEIRAAKSLIKCMEGKKRPKAIYTRIPHVSADGATTDKEPFVYLMNMLKSLDDKTVCAALFNGHAWYDLPHIGVVIVCYVYENYEQIKQNILAMTKFFWDNKDNLKIKEALLVQDAVEKSLESKELLLLTDSGDNTTAGAKGSGTLVLREYLKRDAKNVLVTGIFDIKVTRELMQKEIGSKQSVILSQGKYEKQEIETEIEIELIGKGDVLGWAGDHVGKGVLVRCKGVDIVVTDARCAFTSMEHFECMGIDPNDYKVIVLKMGYLFPKLKDISEKFIFALTPGSSTNDFSQINYKNVFKKLYPVEKNITWEQLSENELEVVE